jgi:hypothetical protein
VSTKTHWGFPTGYTCYMPCNTWQNAQRTSSVCTWNSASPIAQVVRRNTDLIKALLAQQRGHVGCIAAAYCKVPDVKYRPTDWLFWLTFLSSVASVLLYKCLNSTLNYARKSVASFLHNSSFFFVVKGSAADATDAPQPWGLLCNPVMMIVFFRFYL